MFKDSTIGASVVIAIICLMIAFGWGYFTEFPKLGDLLVEFWGLFFDVLVILVGFGVIQYRKQRRDDILRHEEVIEDLKRWTSEEAKHRIFGAMRRLNKMKKTNFDLTGADISYVSFSAFGVSSINGSIIFSNGEVADNYQARTKFAGVDFSHLNAQKVIFEKVSTLRLGGVPIVVGCRAKYVSCNFYDADLRFSKFDGAELIWQHTPPESLYVYQGEDADGQPYFNRETFDGFNDADVSNASFRYCKFKYADFRLAKNLELADFSHAEGLDTCVFDDEETKNNIIEMSKLRHDVAS